MTEWGLIHYNATVMCYMNKNKQYIKALITVFYNSYTILVSIEIGILTCAAVVTKPRNKWHEFCDWPAEGEDTT